MAVCVAVVDQDNQPLFLKSVQTDSPLAFHYIVHTSLDFVEEKASVKVASSSVSVDSRELYLGLLYSIEDYKVYGYVTNTRAKLIVIIDAVNTNLRDADIRLLFRKLHSAYVELISSPFYKVREPISSRKFGKVVEEMLLPARTE